MKYVSRVPFGCNPDLESGQLAVLCPFFYQNRVPYHLIWNNPLFDLFCLFVHVCLMDVLKYWGFVEEFWDHEMVYFPLLGFSSWVYFSDIWMHLCLVLNFLLFSLISSGQPCLTFFFRRRPDSHRVVTCATCMPRVIRSEPSIRWAPLCHDGF